MAHAELTIKPDCATENLSRSVHDSLSKMGGCRSQRHRTGHPQEAGTPFDTRDLRRIQNSS
jgi:hypothetical protein